MAASKTSKKTKKKNTSKRKTPQRRKSNSKQKKNALDKIRGDSLSLNAKDLLAVIGGVVALSLSVVTILGWKFVTNDEFTEHATKVQQEKTSVQMETAKADKEIEDKVFKLKFDDKELEKSIELLEREDEHIKEKIQEVVVRQENTDSKVERIDKNIVILLEQSRLEPAPPPQLKPIPRTRHYEEAPAEEGE